MACQQQDERSPARFFALVDYRDPLAPVVYLVPSESLDDAVAEQTAVTTSSDRSRSRLEVAPYPTVGITTFRSSLLVGSSLAARPGDSWIRKRRTSTSTVAWVGELDFGLMNQVPGSAATAPITVAHDGDQVRLLVGDRVVVAGADISMLVEAANALATPILLMLSAGTSLRLELPRTEGHGARSGPRTQRFDR